MKCVHMQMTNIKSDTDDNDTYIQTPDANLMIFFFFDDENLIYIVL